MSASGSKGRQRNASSLKWDSTRKGSTINQPVGRRPLPEPMTVGNTILMVVLHVCRKVVLIDPKYKVGVYFAFLFVGSALADSGFPIPPTYFSNKHNFLNQYFVKVGWAWTCSLLSLYIYLTASVYCAGERSRVFSHLSRLLVATVIWFICTTSFVYIESRTASCSHSKITSRSICIRKGYQWLGLDISGHCFILIYSHLMISQELRTLLNWERIADIVRNEQFDEDSPIKDLEPEQKSKIKSNYDNFTPYIRTLFILLTLLALLWDVMLVATVLYFHNLVQKIFGGIFAVVFWYFTYKVWFPSKMPPPQPGVGLIRYSESYRRG